MPRFFQKGLKKYVSKKRDNTTSMQNLSQEEQMSSLYQNLTRQQYEQMGMSSSKRITEEAFPEDKSWSSDSESEEKKREGHRESQPLPDDLQDKSMSESSEPEGSLQQRDNQHAMSKSTKLFDSSKINPEKENNARKTEKSVFPEDVTDESSEEEESDIPPKEETKDDPKEETKEDNKARTRERHKSNRESVFPEDISAEELSSDPYKLHSSESLGQDNALNLQNLARDQLASQKSDYSPLKHSDNIEMRRGRGDQDTRIQIPEQKPREI